MRFTKMGLLGLLVVGCSSAPEQAPTGERVSASMQRTRAGYGPFGSYVSSHLLLTDSNGEALECSNGSLSVTISVSTAGEDGPFEVINSAEVRCPDGPSGDLAVVLDNSGSTSNVLGELQGAATDLMLDVLDAEGAVGLVRVSTNASVLQPVTTDSVLLAEGLYEGLVEDSKGWTALWDGVRMGNEVLGGAAITRAEAEEYENLSAFCDASDRLGIVVFTDGQENNSLDEQEYNHDAYPGDGFATGIADLKNLHVNGQTTPIYTIGLGDEPAHDVLTDLAESTGGVHRRIEDVSQIGGVFETIGQYFESTHQVCAPLPEEICGDAWIKIEWSLNSEEGGIESGTSLQQTTVDCPVGDGTGRRSTIVLTMSNPNIPEGDAEKLAVNTLDWVAGSIAEPNVLVVLDDNHHNEFSSDPDIIAGWLSDAGYSVSRLDEPEEGLSDSDLVGYDVVWFSNPGYPVDDLNSLNALSAFNANGGGLVLQGDDITWSWGNAFSMTPITGLINISNGTTTCGEHTDNNVGELFEITIAGEHPMFAGISDTTWLYGDDIDDSVAAGADEIVLAFAESASEPGCGVRPAILTYNPF